MEQEIDRMRVFPKALAAAAGIVFAGLSVFVTLDHNRRLFGFLRHVPGSDVSAHFVLMGALSFLMSWGFSPARGEAMARVIARTTVILLSVISLEECSQIFLETRTFSWLDLSAGWAGVVACAWMAYRVRVGARPSRAGRQDDPAHEG